MRQYQDGRQILWRLTNVSGTDTITATAKPTFAAYVTGMSISFTPANNNTGAVTINLNGMGAKSITKEGSTALSSGDLTSGREYLAVYDGTRFQLVNGTGSGGGGGSVWARVGPDGTELATSSTGITSVTRQGQGWYRVVPATSFTTNGGGNYAVGIEVTCATPGSTGGSGSSPFKAYDSYSAWLTDDSENNGMGVSVSDGYLLVPGETTDDLWIHDMANWGGTPTQVALTGSLYGAGEYFAVRQDEDGVFLSLDSTLNYVALPGGSVTDFSGAFTGTQLKPRASRVVSGSLKLWMADFGTFGQYTVSLAGPSLSLDHSYSGVDWNQSGSWQFDSDGYPWYATVDGGLHQYDFTSNAKATHAYPTATPTGTTLSATPGGQAMVYDPTRRMLYVILLSAAGQHLYQYSGWTNLVNNSGMWTYIANLGTGTSTIPMWYDAADDILLVATSAGRVVRFFGNPKTVLDTVTMPGTIPSHQVRYGAYYKDNYAYVRTEVGTTPNHIVRISYNGDEIAWGDGGAIVPYVPRANYNIVSASAVDVYTYGTTNPDIRVDSEFTIELLT
jgi:hypothetical protein